MKLKNVLIFSITVGVLLLSLLSCDGRTELITDAVVPVVTFSVTDSLQTKSYDGKGNVITSTLGAGDEYCGWMHSMQ